MLSSYLKLFSLTSVLLSFYKMLGGVVLMEGILKSFVGLYR